MALDMKDNLNSTGSEFELRDDDRFSAYETDRERSHFGAFLMGGMVVAGGLLAFLYYDTDNLNGMGTRDLTTGSINRMDNPVPSLKLTPTAPDEAGKR